MTDPGGAAPAADGSETAWPSVTVVVPTHDRSDLLEHAVGSIFEQDYPGAVECVVSFDRADPRAPSVRERAGRTLCLVANDHEPGPSGARNAGAVAGSGQILAFCDDDDRWAPSKLRAQVEAMRRTGLRVSTCGIEVLAGTRTFVRLPPEDRVTLDQLLASREAWLHTSTLVLERAMYTDVVGPLDEAIPASYGEDYDWVLRSTRVEPIAAVRQPLVTVSWNRRGYADRWEANVAALRYLLAKHPDLERDPRNGARIAGQIAFASAALHRRRDAATWAWRAFRARPAELRVYLAMLVAYARVPPAAVLRAIGMAGKAM